jgi:hypothetical protein
MIQPLRAAPLEIDARLADDVIRVDWRGRSNSQHPGALLDPYLGEVIAAAEGPGHRIEMHFEALDYFNSATVSALIQFIRKAKERGVRVAFYYDESRRWQKLSFDALAIFSDGDRLMFDGRAAAAA